MEDFTGIPSVSLHGIGGDYGDTDIEEELTQELTEQDLELEEFSDQESVDTEVTLTQADTARSMPISEPARSMPICEPAMRKYPFKLKHTECG